MPDLSDNQVRVMAVLRDGEQPLTTERLGRVRDRGRNPLGSDAVRKLLTRLQARNLVTGDGTGATREWRLTDLGEAAINEAKPPKTGVESAGTDGRPYTVLEQTSLHALIERCSKADALEDLAAFLEEIADAEVYVIAGQTEARNTEHAFRKVAKEVYADRESDDGEVTVPSVAIDGKRWKITPVRVFSEPSVAIG